MKEFYKIMKLREQAIREWNSISDTPIGTESHKKQIRAFIVGKGESCTKEDILDFIAQDMLD